MKDPMIGRLAERPEYLLELIAADAKKNLEEEIVEAVRSKIRDHVERAFLAIKPRLEASMNHFDRELILRLTVGKENAA